MIFGLTERNFPVTILNLDRCKIILLLTIGKEIRGITSFVMCLKKENLLLQNLIEKNFLSCILNFTKWKNYVAIIDRFKKINYKENRAFI